MPIGMHMSTTKRIIWYSHDTPNYGVLCEKGKGEDLFGCSGFEYVGD